MKELVAIYSYAGSGLVGSSTIGEVYCDLPDDSEQRVSNVLLVATTDLEQAERWRSLLAAGITPNRSTDPPIWEPDEQLRAELDEFARDYMRSFH